MNSDGATGLFSRLGRNPEAKSINELRQKNLSPEQRTDDPSAPQRFVAREQERDERDRTRRDYGD